MQKDDLLKRLDAVLEKGRATVASASVRNPPEGFDPDSAWVDKASAARFRTAGMAALYSLFTANSPHVVDFEVLSKQNTVGSYRRALAIIDTIREDAVNDWLVDTRALIAGETFSNIMDMAEHLLEQGYKDPAAVLVGGSLEGHLRNLADRHSIPIEAVDKNGKMKPKAASLLNEELAKAKVYGLGDQKQIVAWLDLRNDAAHGHYAKYPHEKIDFMLAGVRNFIVRVPA